MFDLEKREKFIVLAILAALIAGLFVRSCQNRAVPVYIKSDSFTPQGEPSEQAGRININEAGADELMRLKGVGPALAGRIIDYRSKNGYFRSTEELKKIKGVGEKLFEKIKEKITIE